MACKAYCSWPEGGECTCGSVAAMDRVMHKLTLPARRARLFHEARLEQSRRTKAKKRKEASDD